MNVKTIQKVMEKYVEIFGNQIFISEIVSVFDGLLIKDIDGQEYIYSETTNNFYKVSNWKERA